MAGCLAGGFAQVFGHLDDGLLAGLVHDLGKYSDAFQRRIQDPDHSGLVDHSTAGAMLLVQHGCPLASMAVAGHHAGLPDFGSRGELEGPTYSARMNRAFSAGSCGPLALSKAWEQQLNIPQSAFEKGTKPSNSIAMNGKSGEQSFYSDMMLTRMLFSTLVDGDRLDAEFFTSNRESRTEHPLLESLKEYLGADSLASEQVLKWDKLRKASLMVVFPAEFQLWEDDSDPVGFEQGHRDLGYMLYDFDYRNPAHPVPLFFRAELNDGVMDVESVEVKS